MKRRMSTSKKRDWSVFINSVCFVLGFSFVFSLAGVLLQSVFSGISFAVQTWLSRIGGVLIVFFGIYLLGIIRVPFLEKERRVRVKKRFSSSYITSFVFGAAFAIGWSPCVGAILGAVLTLAVTSPSLAFFYLLAYSLGIGIPFLIVGFFANEATKLLSKASKWIKYCNYVFGIVLIAVGALVFTSQLGRLSNFAYASGILVDVDIGGGAGSLGIGIAFLGGLVSFISPCVFPLIPAFLTYLASLAIKK